jgi:hypothetical protein
MVGGIVVVRCRRMGRSKKEKGMVRIRVMVR